MVNAQPQTIADFLFSMPTLKGKIELENFRKIYEAQHGPTDLTRRYTSTWNRRDQDALLKIDPMAYFNGLPDFVQRFIQKKLQTAAAAGQLDNCSSDQIAIYIKQSMGDNRSR